VAALAQLLPMSMVVAAALVVEPLLSSQQLL
jgi:hypothetical protein